MRQFRSSLAAIVIACCALGACGSDAASDDTGSSSPAVSETSAATGPADTTATPDSGSDATQPATGDVDCAALKDNLAKITVNWQVVIGLTSQPASAWSSIPLGTLADFGDQLDAVTPALSSDAEAADALAFMSGANDIVQTGLGGEDAAQADLATYMGTDVNALVAKQVPIALAYDKVGCS
jgi:hypothetical protein